MQDTVLFNFIPIAIPLEIAMPRKLGATLLYSGYLSFILLIKPHVFSQTFGYDALLWSDSRSAFLDGVGEEF